MASPSMAGPNWTREGVAPPSFLLHLLLFPSIPSWKMKGTPTRRGRKGKRERRKWGPAPLPIRIGLGGRAPPLGRLLLSSTKTHEGPLTPRGFPVTPRYSRKCPNLSETFLVSKHNLPIYQSLCLDHFETPCHVRDLIRDSERPSVHQNT